jgi:hypothetical protein
LNNFDEQSSKRSITGQEIEKTSKSHQQEAINKKQEGSVHLRLRFAFVELNKNVETANELGK